MEIKQVSTIITITVVIICVAAILVPVVDDAKYTMGDEATFTNTTTSTALNYALWDGEDITFTFTYATSSTYAIDGTDVSDYVLASAGQDIVLASNAFAARTAGTSSAITMNAQYLTDTAGWTASFTFSVTDGVYTVTKGGETYGTGDLEWLVYATEDGTMNLGQLASTARESFYTSETDDLIVLGNIYTTGDNDTFYSYYNGDLSVSSTYEDDSSVTITKNLVSGYLDVYTTSLTVNVGDESFAPYYILAPVEVTGTEESEYNALIAAIPVMVIVGLLVTTIGMMVIRRND